MSSIKTENVLVEERDPDRIHHEVFSRVWFCCQFGHEGF